MLLFQWFLEKTGHAGLNNLLAAYEDKSAYAQCIFSLSLGPGDVPITFTGRTHGRIVAARGPVDFGFVIIIISPPPRRVADRLVQLGPDIPA
jgi:inosine/xanthosine triphosphate pyrophosphatase family protein